MVPEPLNCSQSLVYVRTPIMYIVLTKNYEEFKLHTIWLIKYNRLYVKEGYEHIFIGYLYRLSLQGYGNYDYYYWVR